MFIVVRAKRALAILGLTIFAFGGIIIACNRTLVPVFSQNTAEKQTCYVIDAGHGGEDGGAVSPDGVVESTLNLAIAQRTRGLLSFLGTFTTMTRSGQARCRNSEGKEAFRSGKPGGAGEPLRARDIGQYPSEQSALCALCSGRPGVF